MSTTLTEPIIFYDGGGPGFQTAVVSEFAKLGGKAYEKEQPLYELWKKQKNPFIGAIFEISKDFAVVVFHVPTFLKYPNQENQPNQIIESLINFYSDLIFLLQGFDQISINHLFHTYILQTSIEDHFTWIPTRHAADSALCLRSIAKRIQIEDKPPSMGRVKPKWKNLAEAQIMLLEGLLLTGDKKAQALADNYESPIKILRRIVQSEKIGIKGFAEKFDEKNRELLTSIKKK